MKRFLAVAIAVLVGCNSREITLDAKFFPLQQVQEVSDKTPGVPADLIFTVYGTTYTGDMAGLVAARPVGSLAWDACFFHEQQHSIHQFQDPFFFVNYAADKDTRWREEQIGYGTEIRYLKSHGVQVNVDGYVAAMTDPGYYGMCSADEARAFVLKVLREP